MTEEYLLVGEIRRAHGLQGACLVAVFTDRPDAVYAEGRSLTVGTEEAEPAAEWGRLTVERARRGKGGWLVQFQEIRDRTVAESFRGRTLLIPRSEAEPLEPDEFFVRDLIGLEVRTVVGELGGVEGRAGAGERVGQVTDVYEAAPAYLLAVSGPEGEQLLPMQKEFVRAVDLERGIVTIEPPAGWPG